jgi:CitMHS family citrate-Mg2+:H+ or citrate-Ca2+:H+ symporter
MAALILGLAPLPVLFMVAFALAMAVNYPSLADQRARLQAHAPNALAVAGLIFAAGGFTGILSGSGMVDALGAAVVAAIPPQVGSAFAPIVAGLSVPFTFLVSNDAFYFGLLPILAQTGQAYGVPADALARAALVGQQVHLLSPLVPSTYLLVNLTGIEFGQHLRFTLPWALGACLVMFVAGLAFGVFPFAV